MFLPLFDVCCVWAVGAYELLGEFIALIEAFFADVDAMFKVVEFVLKNLNFLTSINKKKSIKIPQTHQ